MLAIVSKSPSSYDGYQFDNWKNTLDRLKVRGVTDLSILLGAMKMVQHSSDNLKRGSYTMPWTCTYRHTVSSNQCHHVYPEFEMFMCTDRNGSWVLHSFQPHKDDPKGHYRYDKYDFVMPVMDGSSNLTREHTGGSIRLGDIMSLSLTQAKKPMKASVYNVGNGMYEKLIDGKKSKLLMPIKDVSIVTF